MPDYIITSGQDAIPASIHYADLFKKAFSGMKINKIKKKRPRTIRVALLNPPYKKFTWAIQICPL
jgi:hypothetical protein